MSVLETEYVEASRPYSQIELESERDRYYRQLRIGKFRVEHVKCGHTYLARSNGKKEKETKETGIVDTGRCSVCWKLSKTPQKLRQKAKRLIIVYQEYLDSNLDLELSYDGNDIERSYYTWLYTEFA